MKRIAAVPETLRAHWVAAGRAGRRDDLRLPPRADDARVVDGSYHRRIGAKQPQQPWADKTGGCAGARYPDAPRRGYASAAQRPAARCAGRKTVATDTPGPVPHRRRSPRRKTRLRSARRRASSVRRRSPRDSAPPHRNRRSAHLCAGFSSPIFIAAACSGVSVRKQNFCQAS